MKVTIFANIKETKKPFFVTVERLLGRIRGGSSKELIKRIRSEENKEIRNQYKSLLPSALFSGTFKQRNNNSLMDHSGLICLDFDDIDWQKKKDELKNDPYIFACWVSPSGNGLKALVRIPTDNHKASFLALAEKYKGIDEACKDVARVCYESYDPDIYINRESKVYEKQIVKTFEKVEVKIPLDDSFDIYERLKTWMDNQHQYFTEGSRNVFIFRLSAACCRFGIPKDLSRLYQLRDFIDGSTDFQISEFEKCVEQGYKIAGFDFGSAKFEDEKTIISKQTMNVISGEILDLDEPITDVLLAENSIGEAWNIYRNGYSKSETTHFIEIDKIFRMQKGQITVLHGFGNHGKSTIMFEILLNRAWFNGEKFAIFSPEQFPAMDFYNDLVEMFVGLSISPRGYTKQMTEDQFIEAYEFVNKHFFYVYPETNSPTPEYILSKFHEMIVKKKVDGVVIDPYNQLEHDFSLRDDQYISVFLTACKRFALKENVYFWILAHPNGRITMGKDGNFLPPHVAQLSGGMMWSNKADNILCYHRPEFVTNPKSATCVLKSQKIKRQKTCGRPGEVTMEFDIKHNRFLINGYNPRKSNSSETEFEKTFPKIEKKDIENNSFPVQQNIDFYSPTESPF
tara:strand:- start:5909 stop:7786 length:1878 start_codon:yes stop_codon:yes gene_type:complete